MFADSDSSLDRTKNNLSWGENDLGWGGASFTLSMKSKPENVKGNPKFRVPGFILPGEDHFPLMCKGYQSSETFVKTHTKPHPGEKYFAQQL